MKKEFQRFVCAMVPAWRALFTVTTVLLLLLVVSFVLMDGRSGSYYISIISFVLLVPMFLSSAVAIWYCKSRGKYPNSQEL